MSLKVLIHPDGGKSVGLGHLSRSLALAQALIRNGEQVFIAVNSEIAPLIEPYRYDEGRVVIIDHPNDVIDTAQRLCVNFLVIDNYRWGVDDLIAALGPWKMILFDDVGSSNFPADSFINGSPDAMQNNYVSASRCQSFLGSKYQIIRDEVRLRRDVRAIGEVSRVILLVGGWDREDLVLRISTVVDDILRKSNPKIVCDVICGPFTSLTNLSRFKNLEFHRDPRDLPDRLAQADLAISAGGQTLYELIYCGTPTVAFIASEDQERNVKSLEKYGALLNAGDFSHRDFIDKLRLEFIRLLQDSVLRQDIVSNGLDLIDGAGAERIAAGMRNMNSIVFQNDY